MYPLLRRSRIILYGSTNVGVLFDENVDESSVLPTPVNDVQRRPGSYAREPSGRVCVDDDPSQMVHDQIDRESLPKDDVVGT